MDSNRGDVNMDFSNFSYELDATYDISDLNSTDKLNDESNDILDSNLSRSKDFNGTCSSDSNVSYKIINTLNGTYDVSDLNITAKPNGILDPDLSRSKHFNGTCTSDSNISYEIISELNGTYDISDLNITVKPNDVLDPDFLRNEDFNSSYSSGSNISYKIINTLNGTYDISDLNISCIYASCEELEHELNVTYQTIRDELNATYKVMDVSANSVKSEKSCENGFHPAEIGDVFCNRYRVDEKIGFGGSSTVWRCWDMKTKRYVALKIVNSDPFFTDAAIHEISMLQLIKPRILFKFFNLFNRSNGWKKFNRILGHFKLVGVDCIHVCIVLELMEGNLIDLFHTSGGIEIIRDNANNIIKQVIKGLDYFHSHCMLIHTDIKPDNILYRFKDGKMSVQIADFGSCCTVSHPYSKGCQTHAYRSPEILLGATYGQAADIWSTACLAFVLATGHHLFDSADGDNIDYLDNIISVLGEMPKHVALSGELSYEFFTEDGELLYPRERKSQSLYRLLIENHKWDSIEASEFADLLLPMLDYDPVKRAWPCLKHPWIQKKRE